MIEKICKIKFDSKSAFRNNFINNHNKIIKPFIYYTWLNRNKTKVSKKLLDANLNNLKNNLNLYHHFARHICRFFTTNLMRMQLMFIYCNTLIETVTELPVYCKHST